MDNLTSIIVAVLGAIGAFDLGRLIFFKAGKKKANAEAEGQEMENASIEVETLRKAIDTLDQQLIRSHETIERQEKAIAELTDKNERYRATITALFDDMCVHKGCRLRKPHQGQGSTWYEKYREDPALGADYLPIDTLMRQDRAKRQNLFKDEDDGNDK